MSRDFSYCIFVANLTLDGSITSSCGTSNINEPRQYTLEYPPITQKIRLQQKAILTFFFKIMQFPN